MHNSPASNAPSWISYRTSLLLFPDSDAFEFEQNNQTHLLQDQTHHHQGRTAGEFGMKSREPRRQAS
jgi:hypothetical protein